MSGDDQRIIDEYLALLDRSQQLFSGLRDLPNFGKQWQPYFQRTFEVYTKLWKFQQIHRNVLETKERDRFSFKRHDIGEIASKIGQLYYHYYLRTSETNYLTESFIFYDAIRSRGYFKDVLEKTPAPMVKKLRYYARFIVVCLLLNKRQMIDSLVHELSVQAEAYIKNFRPSDSHEWQFVLQEIGQFLNADTVVTIDNSNSLIPSRRIVSKPSIPIEEAVPERSNANPTVIDAPNPISNLIGSNSARIKLQEAILVGNYQNQVKFSELTLDMYRIMQALEREPNPSEEKLEGRVETEVERLTMKGKRNAHKYLLYRPTISQLMVFLSNSFKELLDNHVLLLYLSAEGISSPFVDSPLDHSSNSSPNSILNNDNYKNGGILLNSRRSSEKQLSGITPDCFFPNDLIPFTRKHMFLIVDSDNSSAFSSLPILFGKHLLCLLSPTHQPADIKEPTKIGNLFTLFLCDPLTAFFCIMGKTNISKETYDLCLSFKDKMFDEIGNLLLEQGSIPAPYLQEDFLRNFILNFCFCTSSMMFHTQFQHPEKEDFYWPSIHPPLPRDLFRHSLIRSTVYQMAAFIDSVDLLIKTADDNNPNPK